MTTTQLARKQSAQVSQPLEFTDEQTAMIRSTYANGASDSEFHVLMEVARARNLNPLLRQIFFVKRWNSAQKREVWAAQVSIDGLRAIAQRTGLYDGQDEPLYEHDEKKWPTLAKVKVYRKDWARPAVGVAYFEEYAVSASGSLTPMWQGKPHIMIAKCAEALALRKAFPEDTGGIYIAEEMGDGEVPHLHPHVRASDVLEIVPKQPALMPPSVVEEPQAEAPKEVIENTDISRISSFGRMAMKVETSTALSGLSTEFKKTPASVALTMAVSKIYEERRSELKQGLSRQSNINVAQHIADYRARGA